ncbi:hypothetical protein [uncultured Deinococcus sp.]|uniref:hypothetical protein n=1 Tax=uncultured Deinococcus sp. TaxID=158789 RepID=UPI00258B2879|nr:hypothetical protein [uncultured Deinococcus sp.]
MPPSLPKRCPNCGRKCAKTLAGYWLCDPTAGGCGWTDDPGTLQPAEAAAPQVVEASPASGSPAES